MIKELCCLLMLADGSPYLNWQGANSDRLHIGFGNPEWRVQSSAYRLILLAYHYHPVSMDRCGMETTGLRKAAMAAEAKVLFRRQIITDGSRDPTTIHSAEPVEISKRSGSCPADDDEQPMP